MINMLTLSQVYNKDTRTFLLTSFWCDVFVFNFIFTTFIVNFEPVIASWEGYLRIISPQNLQKVH